MLTEEDVLMSERTETRMSVRRKLIADVVVVVNWRNLKTTW